jgi:hypothetical protein
MRFDRSSCARLIIVVALRDVDGRFPLSGGVAVAAVVAAVLLRAVASRGPPRDEVAEAAARVSAPGRAATLCPSATLCCAPPPT